MPVGYDARGRMTSRGLTIVLAVALAALVVLLILLVR